MNHSIYSADCTTHLKIVLIALLAGLAVAGLAIPNRVGTPSDTTIIRARDSDEFGRRVHPLSVNLRKARAWRMQAGTWTQRTYSTQAVRTLPH
jgi:hypothetical protein